MKPDIKINNISMLSLGWLRESIDFPTPQSQAETITVPGRNSPIRFTEALANHKIPFESHIYAFANHGFTTNESFINNRNWCCNRSADWVRDSVEFLKDIIGDYSPDKKLGQRCMW